MVSANKQNYYEYPTASALAKKIWLPAFARDRVLNKREVYKERATGGGSGWDNGVGGGWQITPDKGFTNNEFGIKGGALVIRPISGKTGGGTVIRISGRVKDSNGKVMPNIGDDEYELLNITKDKFIVNTWKGSDEEDETATARLIGDKAKSDLAAGLLGKIYKDEFDGKTRRVLKRPDGSLYLTKPLEKTQGQIPRNEGSNNSDVLGQLKASMKFKGTISEFIQWIDSEINKSGIGGQDNTETIVKKSTPTKKKLY